MPPHFVRIVGDYSGDNARNSNTFRLDVSQARFLNVPSVSPGIPTIITLHHQITGNKGNTMKLAYTVAEAATIASVEMPTIVRAIQDGHLRARKVEDDMRVLRCDVAAWLESCPDWATTHPV